MLGWALGAGALGTLGALLWAVWERSGKLEASRQQEKAEEGKARAEAERDAARDTVARLESVVALLKLELARADSARNPDGVGPRLDELLAAHAADPKP